MLQPTLLHGPLSPCFRLDAGERAAGAMKGFLRRSIAPARIFLKRLAACVAAKQNGFWQIVA